MTEAEIQELADKVKALSPPAKLRLAAGLMEAKRSDTALIIIQGVANELNLALMLARKPGR